jgi:rubredoxin
MKTLRHMGIRLESEDEQRKFLDMGVEFSSSHGRPGGGLLANIDLADHDVRWREIEQLTVGRVFIDTVASTFSVADLDSAKFLRVLAKSGGYPQPEEKNGYLCASYDLAEYCPHCGIGKKQVEPLRLKGAPALADNSILQLNWIFDEFFVSRATWEAVFKPQGIGMRPAVVHRTGAEITSAVQLAIPDVCDLAFDEVSDFEECRACGRQKHSPVFRGFLPEPISPSAMIVKSSQSFGSGALAFKLVLVSDALYQRFKEVGLKGAKFWACAQKR